MNPAIINPIKKKFTRLLQILVFFLIIAVGGIWAWQVYRGDWVVQVNGTKVSGAELDGETARTQDLLKSYYGINFEGDEGKKLNDQVRQQALAQLADRALLCRAAKSCGIRVVDDEIEAQIASDQLQAGGLQGFQQILKSQGLTEAQYREYLEEVFLIQKLQEYMTTDVTVQDGEVQEAYQEYKDYLTVPERVKVGHILVKTSEEAGEVISALKQGTDFQELAVKKSIDPSVSQNKGVLGYITEKDSIAEEFLKESFRLQVGEFSQEPVKTEFGYHVIYCFDKQEPGPASYEEVKDGLKQEVLSQKKQDVFTQYLNALRKSSQIFKNPKKSVNFSYV